MPRLCSHISFSKRSLNLWRETCGGGFLSKEVSCCTDYKVEGSPKEIDKMAQANQSKHHKTPMEKLKQLTKVFAHSTATSQVVSSAKLIIGKERARTVFHDSGAEGRTMEMFLQDITKQRTVKFTAQQISIYTDNFKTKLGRGNFEVYKGQLPEGMKIAVKVFNGTLDELTKEQFMNEVGTMGRMRHINIAKLIGFCYDKKLAALVYEYMENRSLDVHLFAPRQEMEWVKLYEIAIRVAKAIAYMHEECHEHITHYDIKPHNILLDANFIPKVSDFGLAKHHNRYVPPDTITAYRGTPGYSAPELLLRNHEITNKCDVYSFGVVLFEIVRRRRNTDVYSSDSIHWFPKLAWDEYEKGNLSSTIMACGIEGKDRQKAERMCMVAFWCVQDSPVARPTMSIVVTMLEGCVEIKVPPKPFQYLSSPGPNTFNSSSETDMSSSYASNEDYSQNSEKLFECSVGPSTSPIVNTSTQAADVPFLTSTPETTIRVQSPLHDTILPATGLSNEDQKIMWYIEALLDDDFITTVPPAIDVLKQSSSRMAEVQHALKDLSTLLGKGFTTMCQNPNLLVQLRWVLSFLSTLSDDEVSPIIKSLVIQIQEETAPLALEFQGAQHILHNFQAKFEFEKKMKLDIIRWKDTMETTIEELKEEQASLAELRSIKAEYEEQLKAIKRKIESVNEKISRSTSAVISTSQKKTKAFEEVKRLGNQYKQVVCERSALEGQNQMAKDIIKEVEDKCALFKEQLEKELDSW
ncbi:Protein kinase domain [Dillenia turbinata]|uniref:Protein kinase domain n=1 Tax=Dillenia turbinata TaxID=194707 RepID=A0AAN8UM47_9MAGN